MSTYRAQQNEWENGPIGIAVRALLSLNHKAGSWLWFHHTVEHYQIDLNEACAGDICRAMLEYKLGEFDKHGNGVGI